MIKVLDLFAGTQSVKKALTKMYNIDHWKCVGDRHFGIVLYDDYREAVIQYIGVDIYSPKDKNLILDLTQENTLMEIKKVLNEWKPDFIWASPVCNKLSRVLTGKGGNYYFEVDKENKTIKPRENWDIKVQPHMKQFQNKEGWEVARKDAILAMKMFENTKKIIDYYKVPFAIENPATALSQYILKDYIKNDTSYCMYGFDYKKPTSIYSNCNLNLKKCIHKNHIANVVGGKKFEYPSHWDRKLSTYANRSSVPPLLINEILGKVIKNG